jgi:hypothetical protein
MVTPLEVYRRFQQYLVTGDFARLPEVVDVAGYTEKCEGLTEWICTASSGSSSPPDLEEGRRRDMVAFIVTLGLTLYMTGMTWSMQVLEYPLFALVGPKEFPAYHRRHNRGLPAFVILPSLAALVSAVALIFTRPARLPLWASVVVAAIDLAVVAVTAAREAPLHARLDREGYAEPVIRQLVRGNWIRTILWTANGLLLLALTVQLVGAVS